MSAIASQITSLTIVYSNVYPGAEQSKHQSSASLAFVWGIHRGPVNSPHKWPVTRKMFPFDDVIIFDLTLILQGHFTGTRTIIRFPVPVKQHWNPLAHMHPLGYDNKTTLKHTTKWCKYIRIYIAGHGWDIFSYLDVDWNALHGWCALISFFGLLNNFLCL